jgi:cardiolipin synthase
MSHEANLHRLSDIAARGWDEEIALIDGRTAVLRDDEFMVIRVIDGIPRGLPERAGPSLRSLVALAVGLPSGSGDVAVGYSGPREESDGEPISRSCEFDPADLIIGGSEQRDCFLGLLGKA